MDDAAPSITRRQLLAGAGIATAGALAGCSERLRMAAEPSPLEQVSITIKNPPSTEDQLAQKISSRLAENMRAAGIQANHEPVEEADLYREVLVHRNFDIFVARHPGYDEPDAIRSLLHSDFINEQGWQNPFRFSDEFIDELLEDQCYDDPSDRRETFEMLFETMGTTAPFTTVAYPSHIGAVRSETEIERPPRGAIEYLEVLSQRAPSDDDSALHVGIVGRSLADRLNPIAVDLGDTNAVLDLLYAPLARQTDAGLTPWLAETTGWNDPSMRTPGPLEATITLRDGLTWHDGEALDAEDVEFTIDMLQDTSLGEDENEMPAPRYRGRTTLIENVTVIDEQTVTFSFGSKSKAVAERVLSLPILPKHIWKSKTTVTNYLTEALDWDNDEPVGSGLYAFAESSSNNYIRLQPYEDHVFFGADDEQIPDVLAGSTLTEWIEFHLAPNSGAIINNLIEGELDLIGTSLSPDELELLEDAEETTVVESPTNSFYIVGYNLDHPEFTNPRFRRVISQLIDREHLANDEDFFDGYAVPATAVDSLMGFKPGEWELLDGEYDEDPLEFPGSDGEIDKQAARALFEAENYRYDDGDLVT